MIILRTFDHAFTSFKSISIKSGLRKCVSNSAEDIMKIHQAASSDEKLEVHLLKGYFYQVTALTRKLHQIQCGLSDFSGEVGLGVKR